MIDERGILNREEVQALVFLWNQARIKVASSVVAAGRGVPQGSIVSPLLFSIFTQLLIEHFDDTPILKSNMMFYADDLAIYSENLPGIMQAIGKVKEWSDENNMELNNSKSAVMEFLTAYKRGTLKEGELIMEIPVKFEYKYLGITFDRRMSLDTHLKQIKKKCNTLIQKLTPYLKPKGPNYPHYWRTRRRIFNLFLMPHFNYAARTFAMLGKGTDLAMTCRTMAKKALGFAKNTANHFCYFMIGQNIVDQWNERLDETKTVIQEREEDWDFEDKVGEAFEGRIVPETTTSEIHFNNTATEKEMDRITETFAEFINKYNRQKTKNQPNNRRITLNAIQELAPELEYTNGRLTQLFETKDTDGIRRIIRKMEEL